MSESMDRLELDRLAGKVLSEEDMGDLALARGSRLGIVSILVEIIDKLVAKLVNAESSELDRLAAFIMKELPNEIGRGDPALGESAVDVAIRLLSGLLAARAATKHPS